MYTLIQTLRPRRLLAEQTVLLAVALLIAETFYKFHSFTLECVAFLATWYALDLAAQAVRAFVTRER